MSEQESKREGKVLIVDDEEVIHKLFSKMFAADHHKLLFSTNSSEGFFLFEDERPDVIVLDYRMVGGNGDEFMEKISDAQFEKTSVIMISGHAVPDIDLSERNKRKLFAYFEKPFFDIVKLKETIEKGINRYHH